LSRVQFNDVRHCRLWLIDLGDNSQYNHDGDDISHDFVKTTSRTESVKLHITHKRTRPFVGLYDCPFVRCVWQRVSILWGNGARCFIKKIKGIKIRDQPINTKFGQLSIRKILKIIAIRCHILRLTCTQFDSWCLSVCLFLR